ncbi:MAG: rRNA pseudouridine synthase [Candidatus Aenigmarchaeota archaeon]|nr:rRNA pseudouridine synthase [Candidatus Aenigmarchaeota archaeon]
MSKSVRLLTYLMKTGEFARTSDAENAIKTGQVTVDGKKVTRVQSFVRNNSRIIIEKNGKAASVQPVKNAYLIFNKPPGYICQKSTRGEKSIYDLLSVVSELDERAKRSLFTVGRLDMDTDGLLIMTNDGALEKDLMNPKSHIAKTYIAKVSRDPTIKEKEKLMKGVTIKDDDTGREFFVKALLAKTVGKDRLLMTIDEGKKRQIKRMLAVLGIEVLALRRVGIGNMRLDKINFGGKNYKISSLAEIRRVVGV